MNTIGKTLAALLLGSVFTMACAVESGDGDVPNEEEVGSTESRLVTVPDWRNDFVAELPLHDGWYGDWYDGWCPAGTYATHYRQVVEKSQGSGDDTALNTVSLFCQRPGGSETFEVSPYRADYGDPSTTPSCGANPDGTPRFMTGGQIKVEDKQGGQHWYKPFQSSTDDTAANGVIMKCPSGTAEASLTGKWGKWYPMKSCPTGSAVCGLTIRVESKQGKGDDTGMNGMHAMCCTVR